VQHEYGTHVPPPRAAHVDRPEEPVMREHPIPRRGEAGSAYIVTLLALVVLTIMALSLVLVTQTEIQSGTAEKTINRVFYSADTGLGIAAASALTSSSYSGRTVVLNRTTNLL